MSDCVELHPPAPTFVQVRGDGRPVTEHVTDRRLTTPAILAQEARLIAWARRHVGAAPSLTAAQDAQQSAARAVAGSGRLVLVIGPAGAGKTTMLAMAVDDLRQQGREVAGLAPSGKAADVLGAEAGCDATTLAKFSTTTTALTARMSIVRLMAPRSSWTRPAWRPPTTWTDSFDWWR